jgi:hypothetical protein
MVGNLFHGELKKFVTISSGLKIISNLVGLKIMSFLIRP